MFERLPSRRSLIALYFGLLALVGVCMASLRHCHGPLAPDPELPSRGDTICAMLVYGPLSYYMYADTLGGLNYDLLRRFCADEGVPLKAEPVVAISDALRRVDEGTADLLASVPADNSLRSSNLLTESLFLDRLVLVQKRMPDGSLNITSALDLARDTVHVEARSPAVARMQNLAKEIGQPIAVAEHPELSGEYLVMKVADGSLPYAVVNELVALPLLERYPDLSMDTPVSFTQFQTWVLRGGNVALLERLNNWIRAFRLTPAYAELLQRYGATSPVGLPAPAQEPAKADKPRQGPEAKTVSAAENPAASAAESGLEQSATEVNNQNSAESEL